MRFVTISALRSATVSLSFLNATLATHAGALYLRRPIGTGESKEASLIRETSAHFAPPETSA
jgi:hypothetical protein